VALRRATRGPRDYTFQKLQSIWDERLRKSGFVDIEAGADLNRYSASSFDDDRVDGPDGWKISRYTQQEDCEFAESRGAIGDTPTASAWRIFAAGAHELPDGPTKNLLLSIAEAGCMTRALLRRHRRTRRAARTLFEAHCRRVGLPSNRLLISGHTRKRYA
jgi:hypothetical protein